MSYEPTVWVDGDHVTSAKLNKLEQGVNSMSYTPTVWNAGDVVTAEKLNKLEQGVAEGGGGGGGLDYPTFTVDEETEEITCDKTYSECVTLCENSEIAENKWFCLIQPTYMGTMESTDDAEAPYITISFSIGNEFLNFWYLADGTITWEVPK